MSDMKRCDRCGAIYKPSETQARILLEYSWNGRTRMSNGGDACPDCAARYAYWWSHPELDAIDATSEVVER